MDNLGNFTIGMGIDLAGLKRDLSQGVSALRNSAKQMADGMRGSFNQMENAAKNSGLKKELQGFAQSGKEAAKEWQNAAGKIAAVMGITAIGAIKAAAEVEEVEGAFENLLGSAKAAKNMLQQISLFAGKTPFNVPDLQEAAKQLLALGWAAKDVIPDLETVGNASSAIGGKQKVEKLNQITMALAQMQIKGKLVGDELMQLHEAGIPALNYMAQAMGKKTDEVMDMVERRMIDGKEAVRAILYEMSHDPKFKDGMAKQADDINVIWSNLIDHLRELVVDFGQALDKHFNLKKVLKDMTDGVDKIKYLFDGLSDSAKGLIINVVAVGGALLGVAAAVGAVGQTLKTLNIGGMLVFIWEKMGLLANLIFSRMIPALIGFVAGLSPVALGIIAVVAAVGLIVVAWQTGFGNIQQHFAVFKQSFLTSWKEFVEGFGGMAKGLAKIFQGIFMLFQDPKKAWNTMVEGIKEFGTSWYNVSFFPQKVLIDGGKAIGATFADGMKEGYSGIQNVISDMGAKIKDIFTWKAPVVDVPKLDGSGSGIQSGQPTIHPGQAKGEEAEKERQREKEEREAYEIARLEAEKANLQIRRTEEETFKAQIAQQKALVDMTKQGTVDRARAELELAQTEKDYADWRKQQDDLDYQRKLEHKQRLLDVEEDRINQQFAMDEITEQQKIQALQALNDKRYALQKEALDRELEAELQGTEDYKEILDKRLQLTDEYNRNRQQLSDNLAALEKNNADAYNAKFTSFADTLNEGYGKLIDGMINKTYDFKNFWGDFADTMRNGFLATLKDMAREWVNTHIIMRAQVAITKTVTTAFSSQALRALIAPMAAAGKALLQFAVQAGKAVIGVIISSAKAVFAIPVVGWALGGAMLYGAYAAMKEISGLANNSVQVPSYDVGSINIKRDQLAQVHKGEVIIPAKGGYADAFRGNMLGGGSGGQSITNHFNVQAVDCKSFLRDNSKDVISFLNQSMRDGKAK